MPNEPGKATGRLTGRLADTHAASISPAAHFEQQVTPEYDLSRGESLKNQRYRKKESHVCRDLPVAGSPGPRGAVRGGGEPAYPGGPALARQLRLPAAPRRKWQLGRLRPLARRADQEGLPA